MKIRHIVTSIVIMAGLFPAGFCSAAGWGDIANQERDRQAVARRAAVKQERMAKRQEAPKMKGVEGYYATVARINGIEGNLDIIKDDCRVMSLNGVVNFGGEDSLRRSQYEAQYNPQKRAMLNQAFAAAYPGSSYDCIGENGRVVKGNVEYTITEGRLIRYSERGQVNYTIVWSGGTTMVSVSDGPEEKQKVTFVVDLMKPERSYVNDVMFTNVSVNSSQQGGQKLDSKQPGAETNIGDLLPTGGNTLKSPSIQRPDSLDWELTFTKNDLIHAVDSFYRKNNDVGNMIDYAYQVMTQPELREQVLMAYQQHLGGKQ